VKPLLLVLTAVSDSVLQAQINTQCLEAGHRVVEVGNLRQAHTLMNNCLNPDLLLIQQQSTSPSAKAQLRRLLAKMRTTPVALIAPGCDVRWQKEMEAVGVTHFFPEPPTPHEIESLLHSVHLGQASESLHSREANGASSLEPKASGGNSAPSKFCIEELEDNQFFLAASPAMFNIYRQIKLLADSDVPVLILGESGTGKEVIANLIHKHSQRARHRFLKLNCAAVPYDLLESELFGHQRGAFTGAIKDRAGKFEQAHKGTLLLDEIGEMGSQMQAKLLRVLQDGQFTRLGAQEASHSDVRILAATNVHMENALTEKKFREDLYYRLSVFTIQIPPLRERREEIPFLVEEFIRRTCADLKDDCNYIFPQKLMDAAMRHDWRGNLRELKNFVTRTIILRDTEAAIRELESREMPAVIPEPDFEGLPDAATHRFAMRSILSDMKDRTEAQLIQDALEVSGWNRRHAAKCLNISYRGLLYKIQQHRITPRLHREMNAASRMAHSGRG
jgi:two-component system response regulator AtoC